LPSGRQSTFENRCAWANVFLQRAGLIAIVKRGVYRITERGRQVLASNPERIDMKFLERFPEYAAWRKRSARRDPTEAPALTPAGEAPPSQTPQELIESTIESLSADLRLSLLDRVRSMSPSGFEALIVDLLVAMGYGGGRAELAQQTKASNDGGIDGLIKEDPLGLDLVVMQAKRYAAGNAVGRPDVQSFAGSLDGNKATKGIFVTTSTFTAGAIDFARSIQKRLVLIDGDELTRLMVRHGVGVRVTQTFELKDIDENVFEEA
jgi:restriction system protein